MISSDHGMNGVVLTRSGAACSSGAVGALPTRFAGTTVGPARRRHPVATDRAKMLAAQIIVMGSINGDSPRPKQWIVDLACAGGWKPWSPWDRGYRDTITGQRRYFFARRMRRKARLLYADLEEE